MNEGFHGQSDSDHNIDSWDKIDPSRSQTPDQLGIDGLYDNQVLISSCVEGQHMH